MANITKSTSASPRRRKRVARKKAGRTLVKVGNSLSVRIPKPLVEAAKLEGRTIELKVVDDGLLISPVRRVREGWAESCEKMREVGDDKLLLGEFENDFDNNGEWEW
jgi:antitoxin MazE